MATYALRQQMAPRNQGNAMSAYLVGQTLKSRRPIFNWLDIEQIAVTVEDLDAVEILSWLDRILGAGDPCRLRVADLLRAG